MSGLTSNCDFTKSYVTWTLDITIMSYGYECIQANHEGSASLKLCFINFNAFYINSAYGAIITYCISIN